MKHPRKILLSSMVFIASACLPAALFANAYTSTANVMAEQFLLEKKHAEADLAPFLKKQGIGPGPIFKACEVAVKRAQALVKAGAVPGKPAFAMLMGLPSSGGGGRGTIATDETGLEIEGGDKKETGSTGGAESPDKDEEAAAAGDLPARHAWPTEAKDSENVFFHTGVRVLTPYTIDPATKKISSDKTKTGGFMEVVGSNIWTWQPQYIEQSRTRFKEYPESAGQVFDGKLDPYAWQPLWNLAEYYDEGWDYLGRLSFEFGADDKPSAATITGSGDVSAEVEITKHLARGWTPNGAWSVGPGLVIGAVTDRQARIVHRNVFAGANAAASFMVNDEKRLALLRIGFGWAKIDGIKYDESPGAEPDTILFDGTVPHYEAKWRPAAQAELWWPLGDSGHVTAGARIYGDNKPDPWTLYLGVTLDVAGALKALNPSKEEKAK